jgi:tripartite-type tricarboxylate transporter receptor subunit TctC
VLSEPAGSLPTRPPGLRQWRRTLRTLGDALKQRASTLGVLALATTLVVAPGALAQTSGSGSPGASGQTIQGSGWPSRPVRVVVPFPPGGPADILARTVTTRLAEALGQQVVTENRGGGNGNIGTELVVHAAADGYTLLLLPSAVIANQTLYARLPFNVQRDLAPVAPIAAFPLMLVTHPSLPVSSVAELTALARARPGTLNYGSAGSGGGAHLAAESFRSAAGIQLVHIPYKGTGPAVLDLLGGQVSLMFASIPSVIQHVRAGKLRALAVTSAHRSAVAPTVPTIAESGIAGFELASWFGLVVPTGTPSDITRRLNADIGRIVRSAEFRDQLQSEGGEALQMSVDGFGEFIRTESVRWARVVREAGARLD